LNSIAQEHLVRIRPGKCWAFLLAVFLCRFAIAQTAPGGKFETIFENDLVAVHTAVLTTPRSVPNVESAHDAFWIGLSNGTLSFMAGNGVQTSVQFETGDTRFFPSFDVSSVLNIGESPMRVVLVALKQRALIGNACDCAGATAKFVCGCKSARHLEGLWAVGLGNVTLAGTTLAAGESFRSAPERDDMLLVAVTSLEVQDEASENDKPISLNAGEATWIRSGRHQFKNIGAAPARFVTLEF
jgi:hypothetical protein